MGRMGSQQSKKLIPYYFEIDGKTYKLGIPEGYDPAQATEQAKLYYKAGKLTPVPKTDRFTDFSPINVTPRYSPPPIDEDYPFAPVGDQDSPFRIINSDEISFGKRGIQSGKSSKHFSREEMQRFNTAATRDELALAVGMSLKDKFETNFDPLDLVQVDKETGELLYFDPKTSKNPGGTNRWTRFENPALFNKWEVGKAVVGTGGYVLGSLPGVLSGNMAAARLGGAAGAGLFTAPIEYWRLKSGEKQGVNIPEYSHPFREASQEGALVAGMTALSDTAMAAAMRPGRINSYYFDKGYLPEFDKGRAHGQAVTDEINRLAERVGVSPNYNPSEAKKSGVAELLDLEATIEAQQSTKQAAGLTEQSRKKTHSSFRTVSSILDRLLKPADETITARAADVGVDIKAATDITSYAPYSRAAQNRRSQETAMRRFGGEIEGERISPDEAVAAIRGSTDPFDPRRGLAEAKQLDDEAEAAAWQEVDKRVGVQWKDTNTSGLGMPNFQPVDNIFVPVKPGSLEIQSLALEYAKAKNTLFKSGTEAQFKDFMSVIEDYVMADGGRGKPIPLSKLIAGIRQLRQIERENFVRVKNSEYKVDDRFLKTLEGSLVDMRDSYLSRGQHGDILEALRAAESKSFEVHEKWARSTLATLVTDKRSAGQVLETIFTPGDATAASNLKAALTNDPEALNVLRRLARARYLDSVYNENGVVDPRKYAAFMRDHGKTIKALVSEEDFGLLQRYGGLGEALQRTIGRQETAERAFKNTFRGRFNSMKSEDIAERLFFTRTPASDNETALLIQHLNKNNPELLNELKLSVMARMRETAVGQTGDFTKITESGIRKLLNQQTKLRMLFGSQYVMDLQTILKSIRILNRSGAAINIPASTPTLSAFRVIFGPLDRTQRFISAGKQYQIAGYEATLWKILSDPNRLRNAIKYGNTPVNADNAGSLFSMLGIQFMLDEQSSNQIPEEDKKKFAEGKK